MKSIFKIALLTAAGLAAPVVCLVYRRGWFATPDDRTSPHGAYEPTMRRIYARCGTWVGDYVWHGWRNRAYGLAYALKPDVFKTRLYIFSDTRRTQHGPLRIIQVAGYREYMLSLGFVHIIAGYRLRPVFDQLGVWLPYGARMDGRPIFSIRAGGTDD